MHVIRTAAVAVGLGMDAMSVSMAVGVRWHGRRQKFRLAWHMGLFQFLMPVLGWLAGQQFAGLIRGVAGYVAAALVIAVGVKMLFEAWRSHPGSVAERAAERKEGRRDPTRGWSLVALSVATSIDALVVGFSLGLQGEGIWLVSIVIGIVAGVMALAGVVLGKRIGRALGGPAEIIGAAVLIALGISFLWV